MLTHPATQHIELWLIERLVEYPRNPRKNDGAVDRMCGSIREFGFKIPCLVRSDGEVVDGIFGSRPRARGRPVAQREPFCWLSAAHCSPGLALRQFLRSIQSFRFLFWR